MPIYRFTITRDVTESAVVTVEADDVETAQDMALSDPEISNNADWAIDDVCGGTPYLPDPGDYTEVSPPACGPRF